MKSALRSAPGLNVQVYAWQNPQQSWSPLYWSSLCIRLARFLAVLGAAMQGMVWDSLSLGNRLGSSR